MYYKLSKVLIIIFLFFKNLRNYAIFHWHKYNNLFYVYKYGVDGIKKGPFSKNGANRVHSKFVGIRERDTQKRFNSVLNAIYPILIQLE